MRATTLRCAVLTALAFVLIAAPTALAQFHSADTTRNKGISISEVLRIVQFFNGGGLHCQGDTEDGFAPGVDVALQNCLPHDSDYTPVDWAINMSELLRLVQMFNLGAYNFCEDDLFAEDGFCPTTPDGRTLTAHFTAEPLTGDAPLTVAFTNASIPGPSPITQYDWSFDSNEENPVHTFNNPGVYSVSLYASCADGTYDGSASQWVLVGPAYALVRLSATPAEYYVPGSTVDLHLDYERVGIVTAFAITVSLPANWSVVELVDVPAGQNWIHGTTGSVAFVPHPYLPPPTGRLTVRLQVPSNYSNIATLQGRVIYRTDGGELYSPYSSVKLRRSE
jgi:hypothetical protein